MLAVLLTLACRTDPSAADVVPTTSDPIEAADAAVGITVDLVEVNQAVGIAVVQGGQPVAAEDRVGPLIAGRDAHVRVVWALQPDFEPRRIEAVLTLVSQGQEHQLSSVKRIEGDADRDELEGTLNFFVEGAQLSGDTTLAVSLLEVDGRAGDPGDNRVPASGGVALEAWADDMALHTTIFPCSMTCGGPPAAITSDQKIITERFLTNVFPVRDLHVTWDDTPVQVDACTFTTVLDAIQQVRFERGAGPHEYYHCVFPESYSHAFAGGFAWELDDDPAAPRVSFSVNWWGPDEELVPNIAHELGHNHGRQHPWNDDGWQPPQAGQTGCNTGWGLGIRSGPHPTTHWSPEVQHPDAVVMPPVPDPGSCGEPIEGGPPQVGDIMGYSHPYWVDTYTWAALARRIRTVSSYSSGTAAADAGYTLFGTPDLDGQVVWALGHGRMQASATTETASLTLDGRVQALAVVPRVDSEGRISGFAIPLPESPASLTTDAAVRGHLTGSFDGHRFEVDLASLPTDR
ncbi:MAG: hypothetical protein KTR31_23165 [Myxococcales bacterium]|nr:hypothetical protein [Myxococcales bacterium]